MTDTFTNVEGRRVVASDTAETIGSVRGFVLDARGRTIEAVHVEGHGKHAMVLGWDAVQAFGVDAVMACPGASPVQVDDEHQKAAVKGVVTLLGARVLTVGGRDVGVVADAEFDTGSGAIVRVTTDHGTIDADRLRSLGSYALVVDEVVPPVEHPAPGGH